MFDYVSCVNDVAEQLFDQLAANNDMRALEELYTLSGNRLSSNHHRSVREEDLGNHVDNKDDDEAQATQNVNLHAV